MKQGEYIKTIKDQVISIEWFTDDVLDCSLNVEDGEHEYFHATEETWQKYTIKDGKFDG